MDGFVAAGGQIEVFHMYDQSMPPFLEFVEYTSSAVRAARETASVVSGHCSALPRPRASISFSKTFGGSYRDEGRALRNCGSEEAVSFPNAPVATHVEFWKSLFYGGYFGIFRKIQVSMGI